MRSFFSHLFGKDMAMAGRTAEGRDGSGRPELLRRRTLAVNSKIVLAASAVALPAGLYALVHGAMLPFVLCIIGLTTGVLTLALHQRGQYERAAAGQVYGTLIAGFLLAMADPAIA